MTALPWISKSERVVGRNSTVYADTLNRVGRQMLSDSGMDPDADFTGLQGPVFNVMSSAFASGAKGDGATDDHLAIAAAEAAAFLAGGILYFPPGKNFLITTGLTIRVGIAQGSEQATITYNGTGTAVTFGNNTSGQTMQRISAFFPQIVQSNKAATGWAQAGGSDIGLKLVNTQRCFFVIPRVANFSIGLQVYGLGAGNVYNQIHVGHLDNNKVNLRPDADATGWSNENSYHLGSLSFNTAEGSNIAGTRQILLPTTTNTINNNRFFGGSLEGNTPEFHLEVFSNDNFFYGMRWEATTPKVQFNSANAVRNVIHYGYNADALVVTAINSAAKNHVFTNSKMRVYGSVGAGGLLVMASSSSANDPLVAGLNAGVDPATADASTAYTFAISPSVYRGKQAADTTERVRIEHGTGKVLLGNGTGTPTAGLQGQGTTGLTVLGSLLGFYGGSPVAKPTITGSRGGNAALASLLTALASLGLIVDSTTA